MAIQFNCPYCTAPIRVPDSAAGKKGTCPKCSTKVIVPEPTQPAPAGTPAQQSEQAAPAVSAPVEVPEDPAAFDFASPEVKRTPAKKVSSGTGATAKKSGKPKKRVVRVRRKRRNTGLPKFVLPLFFGGILIAGLAFVFYQSQELEKLEGTLPGVRITNPEIPTYSVPKANLTMDAEELKVVLDNLRDRVLFIPTDLMKLEIRGSEKGLELTMMTGPGTEWYRVDWRKSANLVKYVSKERSKWDEQRREELDQAANTFVKEYGRVLKQEGTLEDLISYRDRVGINSMVSGFGYCIEARVGGKPYRCVLEDDDGLIYFLLPRELKKFQIRGRDLPDGSSPFNGAYTVNVAGEAIQDSEKKDESGGRNTPADDDLPGLGEQDVNKMTPEK